MRNTKPTPQFQEFLDELQRMNDLYNDSKYTYADAVENELKSQLEDLKTAPRLYVYYPFTEGEDYWTIEDGRVIHSCWDETSEEIFLEHISKGEARRYFKTMQEAYDYLEVHKAIEKAEFFCKSMLSSTAYTTDQYESSKRQFVDFDREWEEKQGKIR